ncbi:MAG TPA: hypothetical protein VK186_13100 [Candidatus Deferrimicrobium sp.]|nr:hypothetical protein [Candidatus Deferrimicrobium sp.]
MNEHKTGYICMKLNLPNNRGNSHEDEKVTGKQIFCLAGNLSTPSNDISLKVMLSIGKVEACTAAAWDYTLKFDAGNSDFLDCNTRIRNNSFGMWNGGTGMLDGESGMWEGGTGVWDSGARMWEDGTGIRDGGSGMRDGGTGVWDGGVGMSGDGTGARDGGSGVWDRCPKAWTFNTIFEVNRKFLDNLAQF